jgi:hypothetical protein
MSSDPVMAVLRVRVPADADPGVVQAELTRAFWERSVAAELVLLPAVRSARRLTDTGLRQQGYIALLCSSPSRPRGERKLTRVTQKAARKGLRRRFGPEASARVRLASSDTEVAAGWWSLRGTPHRI